MRIGTGHTEFVVWSAVAEANELYARIGVEIDQAAARWTVGGACEHADAPVIIIARAIDFLLESGIEPEITGKLCRDSGAYRICE